MRFVWAVAAFVVAAVMIVAGIAQRTVFQGPTTEEATLPVAEGAPYTLIDGAVLNTREGTQNLRVAGDGTIFLAYGRSADMTAWLADTTYNEVSVDGDGDLSATLVEPDEDAPAAGGETAPDEATTGTAPRSPVGSDLWLDEFQQDDLLIVPLELPDSMSVLIASDGETAAPTDISVSWPIRHATPWAGPLIAAGSILMAVGVFLYILAIRHLRRSRGPRRKGPPPLPPTEPIDLAAEGIDKGVISSTRSRRQVSERRAWVFLPAVAISALVLTGCSPDAWPQLAPPATPTPTSTVIIPEGQQQPAVTETQTERILDRIAATVADADESADIALASTRLDGAMLAARTTNYTLRSKMDEPAPSSIPTRPLKIVLPQAYDEWPRSVMTVVQDDADATVPPMIMMMTQADPWADYKLTYAAGLEASAAIPNLAPWYVGASQVPPDSSFLVMPPDEVAAAYADVIDKGEDSAFAAAFDIENDRFRAGVASDRQERLDAFNQTATDTGSLSFSAAAGTRTPIALATIESGAIVAVTIAENDTVKPTNAAASIKLDDNPRAKALTGVTESATGITTTYEDQLFFYVPSQGSTEKIRLLGYSSSILDSKVAP